MTIDMHSKMAFRYEDWTLIMSLVQGHRLLMNVPWGSIHSAVKQSLDLGMSLFTILAHFESQIDKKGKDFTIKPKKSICAPHYRQHA